MKQDEDESASDEDEEEDSDDEDGKYWIQVWTTVFVPVAAHAPISAHPSKFEIVSHKIINHIPISITQEGLDVYLLVFWVDPCKNIEMNKRPPLWTLLSALGSYWNDYGIWDFWVPQFEGKKSLFPSKQPSTNAILCFCVQKETISPRSKISIQIPTFRKFPHFFLSCFWPFPLLPPH